MKLHWSDHAKQRLRERCPGYKFWKIKYEELRDLTPEEENVHRAKRDAIRKTSNALRIILCLKPFKQDCMLVATAYPNDLL